MFKMTKSIIFKFINYTMESYLKSYVRMKIIEIILLNIKVVNIAIPIRAQWELHK